MNADQSATLAYALSLWADWLRNDFAELRPLWYPAESLVLEVRQSVTESTNDDTDGTIEHRIALEVQNAVNNLSPAQRAALERSLGLCAVVRLRDYEARLQEAHDKVWKQIRSRGCL